MIAHLLFVAGAFAGHVESPGQREGQPLQDMVALEATLDGLCKGNPKGHYKTTDGSHVVAGRDCWGEVSPDRGWMRIWWPGNNGRARRPNGLPEQARARVTEDDAVLLEWLGFNKDEFDEIVTTDLVSDVIRENGQFVERVYHGSKTFVDRKYNGTKVVGSRAVITRNANGELLDVKAVWPSFSPDTLIEYTHVSMTKADAAAQAGVDEADVLWVEPVLFVEETAGSDIVLARIVTEVGFLKADGDEWRPTAAYLVDGAPEQDPP